MSFAGQGFVIVQPSEEPPVQGSGQPGQQQGGLLGGLIPWLDGLLPNPEGLAPWFGSCPPNHLRIALIQCCIMTWSVFPM